MTSPTPPLPPALAWAVGDHEYISYGPDGCGLPGSKTAEQQAVWGENPVCTVPEWRAQARNEIADLATATTSGDPR